MSTLTIDYDKLHPGLAEVLTSAAASSVNAEMSAKLDAFMPAPGKATARTAAPKKVVPMISPDSLTADEKYIRPNGEYYYTRMWGEHHDVAVLRKAREDKQFILLYGAPGCGKTALVQAAFEEFETILGTGDTEIADFIGGYVQTASGRFEWSDGPLLKAAERGTPLLIDEVGLVDPKVMSVVYSFMDGTGSYSVTANPDRGVVKAKPGFYVIAATNPNAPGVRLSEALLSRFLIQVEMTTDWSLARKLGAPSTIVTAAQNLAKKQQSGEVSWAPQMRELLGFRDLAKTFGTKFAVANLLAASPELDRPVVADVFTRVFGEECRPAKI
jgi:nitric oxide reductase NorQ protein